MAESVIVALVSAGLGLLGVIIRQLVSFRSNDLKAHERLDAQIDEMRHINDQAHTKTEASLAILSYDVKSHREMTEQKLDAIAANALELKLASDARERYWRDRGETTLERLTRLEVEQEKNE